MKGRQNQPTSKSYFWLPVFIGLGTGLGALINNIGAGMAIGVGVGTVVSLLVWQWEERWRG